MQHKSLLTPATGGAFVDNGYCSSPESSPSDQASPNHQGWPAGRGYDHSDVTYYRLRHSYAGNMNMNGSAPNMMSSACSYASDSTSSSTAGYNAVNAVTLRKGQSPRRHGGALGIVQPCIAETSDDDECAMPAMTVTTPSIKRSPQLYRGKSLDDDSQPDDVTLRGAMLASPLTSFRDVMLRTQSLDNNLLSLHHNHHQQQSRYYQQRTDRGCRNKSLNLDILEDIYWTEVRLSQV